MISLRSVFVITSKINELFARCRDTSTFKAQFRVVGVG